MPKVLGKDCIFVVVDRLTKFSHLFDVTMIFTNAQVAELFFKEVFRLHGLPKRVVSDMDTIFSSVFWKEFFKIEGKNLTPTKRYHPQTDGQIERVNQR